ncbi:hypothetical protein DB41_IP00190 [Neochlamydia sp. TUME1]|nr:hypothetical protein DB41_IP00190 [Neochlamydia sp. TUME1]
MFYRRKEPCYVNGLIACLLKEESCTKLITKVSIHCSLDMASRA